MHSELIRNFAKSLRSEGKTYKEIAEILGLSLFSARKLCIYQRKVPKHRGPKFKISKRIQLLIKRKIFTLKSNAKKVTSSILIKDLDLNVSKSAVQRHMTRIGYKYKRAKYQIILSAKHKEERLKIVSSWIIKNIDWSKAIFSDEKRFSLDGPDDWRTYKLKSESCIRNKQQCKGGGIMCWLMCMPNGLLSFRIIKGAFKADEYIKLLSEMIVPIIKLNYEDDFFYQEDNCRVHKNVKVSKFMADSNIKVIEWPARSPDLNIVEDVWHMISNDVYNGPQFNNRFDLEEKLITVINQINISSRHLIKNLYTGYRSRLVEVLKRHGNLFNK